MYLPVTLLHETDRHGVILYIPEKQWYDQGGQGSTFTVRLPLGISAAVEGEGA